MNFFRAHGLRCAASAALLALAALATVAPAASAQVAPIPQGENDKSLRAMHDELERSVTRLQIAGLEKPFYIEYRLIDLDVRNVTASFGALVSTSVSRERFMVVGVRVGDHHFDSSNFVSEEGFRGFLGAAGQVGIDHDYNSLRQDLWLATDQAYKSALDQIARKRAFLRSLARPPEIDDFSKEPAVVAIDPLPTPDWTSRNWEEEARTASAVLRGYPELDSTRLNYYIVYATSYLMTSEGTLIRSSQSLASVEAALDTQSPDGSSMRDFYAFYTRRPADLPDGKTVAQALDRTGHELAALRTGATIQDYVGPMLFDAPAAGSLLAQALGPSVTGARPPLSMLPMFDQMMERLGGRSEWSGRLGTRVFPASVSLVDDPTAKDFQGQQLLGSYAVDDEGVRAQRVTLVENGVLRNLLMSRRPGPDFDRSNGHGRSVLLSDPRPTSANLFFQSSEAVSPADLKKKFIDLCRADGHPWCLEVKRMDNPALSSQRQEDFNDAIAGLAAGASTGDRLPLIMYRVFVEDGREELVRGVRLSDLTLRSLRNIAGVGNDPALFQYMQSTASGFSGTALGAFGTAQNGIPSSIVAPSLLLEEVEARGSRGERQRAPVLPPPPLN